MTSTTLISHEYRQLFNGLECEAPLRIDLEVNSGLARDCRTTSAASVSSRLNGNLCQSRSEGSSLVEEIKIRNLGEELGILFRPGPDREESLARSSPVVSRQEDGC